LGDVESMVPVVILDSLVAVVSLNSQQPTAQSIIVNVETCYEAKIDENPDRCLQRKVRLQYECHAS
jgi:hypothetical protein